MSIILPKYGLKVPSESTRFRDLGKELREQGISIESVLESFDYHGADPNLVLARVAALEAQTAPIVGRYEGGSYYRAVSGMAIASNSWTVLSALAQWQKVTDMGVGSWVAGIRAPQAGLYRVDFQLVISANLQLVTAIKLNNTAASKAGAVAGTSVQGFAGETFCNVSREIRLAAGDVLTPAVYTPGTSGPYGVNPGEATVFSVEYIRP